MDSRQPPTSTLAGEVAGLKVTSGSTLIGTLIASSAELYGKCRGQSYRCIGRRKCLQDKSILRAHIIFLSTVVSRLWECSRQILLFWHVVVCTLITVYLYIGGFMPVSLLFFKFDVPFLFEKVSFSSKSIKFFNTFKPVITKKN